MVRIKKNMITKGFSGKFGNDIVFKTQGERTFAFPASESSDREPSEKQKAQILRFKMATAYAKAQLADPAKKAYYDAFADDGRTAYNQAVSDFLKPPVIHQVDVSGYSGAVNDEILVLATDNFEVTQVKVQILDSSDTLLEEGSASLNSLGTHYLYKATKSNSSPSGGKVIATAFDRPGNATVHEETLS